MPGRCLARVSPIVKRKCKCNHRSTKKILKALKDRRCLYLGNSNKSGNNNSSGESCKLVFILQGPSIPERCNSHSFRNNFTALETYWCDAMMIGIETNNDRKKKKPLLSSKRNEDYKKKERERCYDNVRKAKVLMKRPKESYWREVETTLHRQRGSKAWVRKLGQDYQVFRKTQWTQFGQFCLRVDFFI